MPGVEEKAEPAPAPDDLGELIRSRGAQPGWKRILLLAGGFLILLVGVVLWITPIIAGSIPCYVIGLLCLGMASERARAWINRLDRKLSVKWRLRLRRGLRKIPVKAVREMVAAAEPSSSPGGDR